MAIKQIRVQINGVWTTLTLNPTLGKYEGNIAAPSITSFSQVNKYYPVTVEASDLAGNVTTKTHTDSTLGSKLRLVVKEVTPPTIVVTSPTEASYLATNTPAITFQLRDETNGSGISIGTLKILVDGIVTPLTNTSPGMAITQVTGGYNVTYTPQTAFTDGGHILKINVSDNDGNAAIEKKLTFTVDTVPPVLSISNPSAATTYTNEPELILGGNTSDITSSSVSLTLNFNGNTRNLIVGSNGLFSETLTLQNGTNTLVIRATDLAGKYSEITRTVILDTAPPQISDITITPNPVNINQSYKVSVTVTD